MADDSVSEFVAVTNSDVDTARFYLESCNGDVTSAVESFFANSDSHAAAPPPQSETHAAPPPSRPRVAGLGDMPEDGDEDDDDEDDGPEDNEYYAGGEKSGVAVKGGKKDNVEDLFESARRHGATQGTESDLGSTSSGVRAFTGQARTLAGDSVPVRVPPADVEPQPVVIAFYTNGVFTIDDGEPRHIDDPRNAEFLQHVRNGECPPELENRSGGRPAKVNLVRKGTDYQPPKQPSYRAFTGTGRTLESGDGVVSHPVNSEHPGGDWEGADESKPVTSIQIRFRDGSRAVARFNYNHTVRDIRRFIAASRPDLPNGVPMMAGIPPKVLTDDSITIEQADLVNAVVTQK